MTPVLDLGENKEGRDLIVGDIHGHFDALEALLNGIAFDPPRDRVISVGDLVDRGPDSDQCLEWLARPYFHSVLGNHELMAMTWVATGSGHIDYVRNGGSWLVSTPHECAVEYADAFESLPVAIELQAGGRRIGVTHGDVPWDDWQAFTDALRSPGRYHGAASTAIWGRDRITAAMSGQKPGPVMGIDRVYVGHTPVRHPTSVSNVVYIDTGVCFGGSLTIVNAADGQAWSMGVGSV